jgi:hypothetical protein
MRKQAVLVLIVSSGAWAQVGGPSLGLVPDGAQVRAMYGMPAAGAVGAVISGGSTLENIAISPAQNYAVATSTNDGSTVLVLASGSVSPIAGAAANASRIVMSPQGSTAALWLPANSHFEILSGLPGTATVRDIDATAFGPPIALAVSDGGQMAGSWADGVRVFGTDGSVTPVSIGGRVLELAFFAQRTDLAAATLTQVISVVNGAASVLDQFGAGSRRQIPDAPAGIAVSADNRWIVTALHGGQVVTVNVASGATARIDCSCTPEGVFAIGGGVFRLTSESVKLIDASSGSVFAVPVAGGQQ